MTAHTPLAGTIARVERENARLPVGSCPVSQADLTALLSCARRCEAIDTAGDILEDWLPSTCAETKQLTAHLGSDALNVWFALEKAMRFARLEQHELVRRDATALTARIRARLDAASERDALAKADEVLSELDTLRAESARLREENGRLRSCGTREIELKAEVARLKQRLSVRTDLEAEKSLELIAAQDRVRELEKRQVTEACPACGDQRVFSCTLPSPSQGVGTMGGERPAFIPAGAPAERLPSGLWCWVEGDEVRIEAEDRLMVWGVKEDEELYANKGQLFRRDVTEPDFLAARAFGQKVLGWE